ncbi:MAG: hypothetical protein U0531_11475 [Dehalococcoidia bacterium]
MFEDFGESLRVAFRGALGDFFAFIPSLLGAIILLLLGWFLGKLIGALVTRALRAVRFNQIADRAEIDTFLRNAGVKADPASVVGAIARWFIYLIFFLAAFNALGLEEVSAVIDSIVAFIPKVVVAIVILFVGALAGKLLAGVVRGSLRSMGVGNADMFGTIARFAVIVFAAIAALDMLQIAPTIVNGLWLAFLALITGTLVLAFGLGGRQAANDLTIGRLLRAELEPGTEVQAGPHRGRVRAIGSLFTTLETEQGIVKAPNSEIAGQTVAMSHEQYQQQVEKREQMKERAKQAVQSRLDADDGRPGAGSRSVPPRPVASTTPTGMTNGHPESRSR